MSKNFGNNVNIFWLIEALFVAILLSSFIYLEWLGFTLASINTFLALLGLFLLLRSTPRVWIWSGFWIAFFWFWWIALSFRYYGFAWAIPMGMVLVASIYMGIFWLWIRMALWIEKNLQLDRLYLKAFFIFVFSYLHPFGFDWLKFELIFVESYFGVAKWQFGLVLIAIVLLVGCISVQQNSMRSIKNGAKDCTLRLFASLILLFFALDFSKPSPYALDSNIKLITTNVSIDKKWDAKYETQQLKSVYAHIQQAIEDNYVTVVLPESVIPKFINKYEEIKDRLKEYSEKINIVVGGLYLDEDGTPRNSTYIFTKDNMQIANKVVLVPFGEANPLPKFLSDIVNKIFYDGAVDYKASYKPSDYKLESTVYRNAICFEATSERLYHPQPNYMIAISNNGWFTPSVEPILQQLLLKYYSKKYQTTIYHSINGSPSYVIYNGTLHTP
jgi:apolipoprotein N-acyltransferase